MSKMGIKKKLRELEDYWYDEREECMLDHYSSKPTGTSDNIKC